MADGKETSAGKEPMPTSVGDHHVPEERLALIRPHVAMLAATARRVGDELPLEADALDMIAALESEVA